MSAQPNLTATTAATSAMRLVAAAAFAIFLLAGTAAMAADSSVEFDSANKLYEQGRFADAASRYEALLRGGSISPTLYFNLGNAFFKAGETGRALAAYRQAEQIAPRDPDVRANLQFVRRQVQGPTLTPDLWQRWLGHLTVNEWAMTASAALWIWLLLLTAGQLRPSLKSSLRPFVWFSGVATGILLMCLGAVFSPGAPASAIVVTRDAAVHNGPLEESQTVFSAHDGAEVRVLDRKDGWIQINVGERRTGWLKSEQVVLLHRG